jgi:hypothetical protein
MAKNELTTEEKNLIKKYESGQKPKKNTFQDKKEMYLKQTDRNYKDGDRN